MKTLSRTLNLLFGLVLILTACNLTSTPTETPIQTELSVAVIETITGTPSAASDLDQAVIQSVNLDQNTNCRVGPGIEYEIVDILPKGQTILIDGRDEENQWLRAQNPPGNDPCWISTEMITTNIDMSQLTVFAVPPAPSKVTETPALIVAAPTTVDLTPPLITNVTLSPTIIQKAGCGTPDTFIISATVTDESGIGNVIYEIIGPGPKDQGDGYLLPMGGDLYQAVIGPIGGNAGDWTLTLTSLDMAFNEAHAGPWIIKVVCIQ